MSADLGPGSVLECISNKQHELVNVPSLTVGALYFVESVVPGSSVNVNELPCKVDGCCGPFLWLKDRGKPGDRPRWAYCPSQFRPFGGACDIVTEEEVKENA